MALRKQLVIFWNPDLFIMLLIMISRTLISIFVYFSLCPMQMLETMAERARINAQRVARKLRRCSSSAW